MVDVWTPDVVLWNSVDDITNTLAMQPVRALSTGDMFWTRNGAIQTACNVRAASYRHSQLRLAAAAIHQAACAA